MCVINAATTFFMSSTEINNLLQNTVTTTDLAVNISYLETLQAKAFKTTSAKNTTSLAPAEITAALNELKARPIITLELAHSLSHLGFEKIVAWLQRNLKQPVIVNTHIDNNLIGGAKISFQGRYLDQTLAATLLNI